MMGALAILGAVGFPFALMRICQFGRSWSYVVVGILSVASLGFVFFAIFPRPVLVLEPVPEGEYDRTRAEVVWKGTSFYKGQRVITNSWSAVVAEDKTGLDVSVNMSRGHVGTVVEARERSHSSSSVPGEPLQALLVLWDEQEWSEVWAFWRKRRIAPFSSMIHACHLQPLN